MSRAWRFWTATVLLALAGTGLVLWRAWGCDDAFITFRYVQNTLAGYGPVFNVGERVQGFTHPLWFVLLLAGGFCADVYAVAVVLGLAATAALFLIVARTWRERLNGWWQLLVVAALLLSSRAFVEYQTSGLETSLTSLLVASLTLTVLCRPQSILLPSVLCGLLVFNRADLVVLCGPIAGWLVWRAWTEGRWRALLAGAVLPAAWFGFATIYYGSPLPNTAYAKVAFPLAVALRHGAAYIADYALHEPLHALLIAIVLVAGTGIAIRDVRQRQRGAGALTAVIVGLWLNLAYVAFVGGDFMRGRFMLPALVVSAVAAAWLLGQGWQERDPASPLTLAIGTLLPIVCCLKILLEGGEHLFQATLDDTQSRSLIVGGVVCLLLLIGGLSRIRRSRLRGVLPGLAAALLCVILARSYDKLPREAATILGLSCAAGAICLARWVQGRPVRSPALAGLVALLPAVVLAGFDLPGRATPPARATVIADEWICYAGGWDENPFREPVQRTNATVHVWVQQGLAAARYAETYGPIAVTQRSIGLFGYHAGPRVHVIDRHGLTDAYIARCPADPASRVGHLRHEIPTGYLESLGAIDLLPHGFERMERLDPSLRPQALAMQRNARWADDDARERAQRVHDMIAGGIWRVERLWRIPAYAGGGW
ncbi:MAG: hypothetical protein PVJ57_09530 [Phycisphaerae bacterium]|jgi:hypothetical protein